LHRLERCWSRKVTPDKASRTVCLDQGIVAGCWPLVARRSGDRPCK
jgi:hypothetical protein